MGRHAAFAVVLMLPVLVVGSVSSATQSSCVAHADPVGDSKTAPDIATVVVCNTSDGDVTFRVGFHGTPPPTVRDTIVLDVDQNATTGDTFLFPGGDYEIVFGAGLNPQLRRWDYRFDLDYEPVPSTTLSVANTQNGATVTINRSELRLTTGFNFAVVAENVETNDADHAPDANGARFNAFWTYRLEGLSGEEGSFSSIVQRVRSGVIRIETTTCAGRTVGTGTLIGPTLVATVEHVVAQARAIRLMQGSRQIGTAVVIGEDRARDIALLRSSRAIAGYRFSLASRSPVLGESVVALGFPLGLPLSVTRGTISGVNRTIVIAGAARRGLVQTDAAINHGNSGGPLVSASGEVLGLVDIGSTAVNGIAFAVSAKIARPLLAAWQAAPKAAGAAKC